MGAIKTMKEVESALPQKKEINYVRALDKDGNPILINKEDLAQVVGELIPTVSDEKDGFISKSINPNMLMTANNKAVFLHKTINRKWNGFSFLFCLSSTLQGMSLIHVFGGLGADSNNVKCYYRIVSQDNIPFTSFSTLKYRVVEESIEIYLVSNTSFGKRCLFQMNVGPGQLSTMKNLNEEPADLIDFIDYDKPTQ